MRNWIGSGSVGFRAALLECGEVIDTVRILCVERGGEHNSLEMQIESLDLDPGAKEEFVFLAVRDREAWRMLFEDPMAGGRCFSQRAPGYDFAPIPDVPRGK